MSKRASKASSAGQANKGAVQAKERPGKHMARFLVVLNQRALKVVVGAGGR